MSDEKEATPASFEEVVGRLGPLLEELESGPAYRGRTLRNLPKKGVYVFYEDGKPMYVGRVGSNSRQNGTLSGFGNIRFLAQGTIRQRLRSDCYRKTFACQ